MKKLLLGLLTLGSISTFAASNCMQELRDLRKDITSYERQNIEVIRFLSNTGEYLVKSGQTLKAALSGGRRVSPEAGSTLVYSGKEVLSSSEIAIDNNNERVDEINLKLNALEDCVTKR